MPAQLPQYLDARLSPGILQQNQNRRACSSWRAAACASGLPKNDFITHTRAHTRTHTHTHTHVKNEQHNLLLTNHVGVDASDCSTSKCTTIGRGWGECGRLWAWQRTHTRKYVSLTWISIMDHPAVGCEREYQTTPSHLWLPRSLYSAPECHVL